MTSSTETPPLGGEWPPEAPASFVGRSPNHHEVEQPLTPAPAGHYRAAYDHDDHDHWLMVVAWNRYGVPMVVDPTNVAGHLMVARALPGFIGIECRMNIGTAFKPLISDWDKEAVNRA